MIRSKKYSDMTTSIQEIEDLVDVVSEDNVSSEMDEQELCDFFFDGNNSISSRLKSLQTLFDKNKDLSMECVNKISSMFMFTPNSIFRSLLTDIVNSNMDINIRTECARAIYDDNKKDGYRCFNLISSEMESFPTPLRLDIIRTLMETDLYYDRTVSLLKDIINNKNLECEYRYKCLLSIQNDNTRSYIPKYLDDAYIAFVKNNSTYTRYRILGSQYILQHKSISIDIKTDIEKICISFATDPDLDYNLRADAADLLVRSGSNSSKDIGRDIITLLGRNSNGLTTVYTNRQNVHDKDIEENIKQFILHISSIRLSTGSDGKYTTFADVQKEIEQLVLDGDFDSIKSIDEDDNKKSSLDKVNSSLLRISIDQTIYDGCQTLQSIFNKVWSIIKSHEYVDVLKRRMIEELIDMADTCSSGHISRIINVLSGFEVEGKSIGINIGWNKQIQSNLLARLNAKIKNIKDEDYKSTILDEMITSGSITNKPKLSLFFRDNLLSIRDEMHKEFVDDGYIDSDSFEEHFRNAIYFFEEGGL